MIGILYFSNNCSHCKELIEWATKLGINNVLRYVCLDNRILKGNKVYAVLPNKSQVLVPDVVKAVPTFVDLRDSTVHVGESIKMKIIPRQKKVQVNPNQSTLSTESKEHIPLAFSDVSGTSSDTFSFINTDSKDLLAEGDGGMKVPHSYAGIGDDFRIQTADEALNEENKVTDSDLEKYIAERDKNISIPKPAI